MQIAAIAPRPAIGATPPIGIDQPSFGPGEQPYRRFLSAMSGARQATETALQTLAGPQPMDMRPGRSDHNVALSVVEARKGVELLTRALGQEAPAHSLASAKSASGDLQNAIELAAMPTPLPVNPVDPDDVANLYRSALSHVDQAISHASYSFAL